MKFYKAFVFILVTLSIVSCTNQGSVDNPEITLEQPTATLEESTATPKPPTATPIPPTATPWPTPTQNPHLLNESALKYEFETYEDHSLRHIIDDVIFAEEENLVLVKTVFGLHFYDAQTWEELLSIDSYLDLVSFDGQDGYLRKPSKVLDVVDGVKQLEFKNLIHFIWNGETFHADDPVSFLGPDGSEIEIDDFCYSFAGDIFFTESGYQRNETGLRVIPSAKYFYLYEGMTSQPYVSLNLDNPHNISDLTLSPDGKYLAFRRNNYGVGTLFLASTEVADSVSPVNVNQGASIRNLGFSPDSSKILLSDQKENVIVVDIASKNKSYFQIAPEDYVDEDGKSWGITKAVFLDDETVVIGTNTGKLVIWNIVENTSASYAAAEDRLYNITPFGSSAVLFSVGDSLKLFDLEDQTVSEIF